jgi:hypothetical protein
MDLYSVALFVHIVGAVLLFVLLTIEGLSLRMGFAAAPISRVVGPIAALAILIPGLYMMNMQWGWAAWVVVGIATWVLIAAGGAYTGISVMGGRMDARTATISWLARVGMGLGVLFDMTVKPELTGSIAAVVAGVILGAAAGLAARPKERAI